MQFLWLDLYIDFDIIQLIIWTVLVVQIVSAVLTLLKVFRSL